MQTIQKLKPKRGLLYAITLLSALVLPFIGYSQFGPPPPTGSGGGNASLPDSPLGVPFDWRLNLLLAFAGIVFAVIVLYKTQKQNPSKEVFNA
jgi:hypothetical protein